jgi:hypothetical protein
MSPSRTVVLVPYLGSIHPECERQLHELERSGYQVRRSGGLAAIDAARSQMATDALADNFDWLMWIDSDIGFAVQDVWRLQSHGLPVIAGIYVKKGLRELACHLLPETRQITFGTGGGLLEIRYAAAGFLLTARETYETLLSRLSLPVCNRQFNRPIVPFFLPMIHDQTPGQPWYLSEDFAFCQRLRDAGYSIWADTTIRLTHYGGHGYTWEDAGSSKTCYATYHFGVP